LHSATIRIAVESVGSGWRNQSLHAHEFGADVKRLALNPTYVEFIFPAPAFAGEERKGAGRTRRCLGFNAPSFKQDA
jgi:hypothetical protein